MITPEAYSSVVMLHSPDKVVVHERPDVSGKLAYAGKWQFLGGHRDKQGDTIEPAIDAAVRELDEETNLGRVDPSALAEHWAGLYQGSDKRGNLIWRHVTAFSLGLTAVRAASLELSPKEGRDGGRLIHLDKSLEVINAHQDNLTPFALERLREFVKSRETRSEPY